MNADFLYSVFKETEKNDFPDLTLGVAAAKVHTPITDEEDKEVRTFIGRHYDCLVDAYASHDKETFVTKVAECEAEDDKEKHDGDAGESEV